MERLKMNEEGLRALIAQGEGLKVELKRELSSKEPREICKEVAALATMQGGYLIVGVSDEGEIHGVENAKVVSRKIEEWIQKYIDPVVTLDSCLIEIDGLPKIIFHVHPSLESVFYYGKRPYLRIGTLSVPADSKQVEQLVLSGKMASEIRNRAAEMIAMRKELDPRQHTAAAIFGQSELATMTYGKLLAQLKIDLDLG